MKSTELVVRLRQPHPFPDLSRFLSPQPTDNLDANTLKVPKEVSLLDYAGFKLHVLDAAPGLD